MVNKTYSFSGFTVKFESEIPISASSHFCNFTGGDELPDMTVKVISCDELPEKGTEIYNRGFSSLYDYNDEKRYFSAYPHRDEYIEYACLRKFDGCYELDVLKSQDLWESLAINSIDIFSELLKREKAVVHSSFIIVNGKALLFIGRSGIGKTTQAKLWEKHRGAIIVNDDKAALGFEKGKLMAYGLPICGSSKVALNYSAPVKAIICLGQSKENKAAKVNASLAFSSILKNMIYEPRFAPECRLAVDMAEKIVSSGKIYILKCTPDEESIKKLEEIL